MGGSKDFFKKGEFKYKTVGVIAGIKVIEGLNGVHNLPMFSWKSGAYLKTDDKGHPRTIRIFKDQEAIKDIDWMHGHGDFKKGEYHVHDIRNGVRSRNPRKPTTDEIEFAEEVRHHERKR